MPWTRVEFSFTETIYPGDCPGDYTIDRYWVITDCNGLQNAILQTITVVDNLPPVILTDLTPDTLDCNDPVFSVRFRLRMHVVAIGT